MDAEDIPDTATPQTPETSYVDGGNLPDANREPSPTDIPDDVVIPPENRSGGVNQTPSSENNSSTISVSEEVIYKSIWPPLIFSFILGITVGTLVLLFGPVKTREIIINQTQPSEPIQTQVVPVDATSIQAHFNKGFGSQGGGLARSIAVDRLKEAQTSIVWITNFPSDVSILRAIQGNTNISAKVIFIGSDAQARDSTGAVSMGLTVLRAQQTLDDNESFLIIDNQYVIDIGRPNTVWETIDPHVAANAREWVETLMKAATPL